MTDARNKALSYALLPGDAGAGTALDMAALACDAIITALIEHASGAAQGLAACTALVVAMKGVSQPAQPSSSWLRRLCACCAGK